MTRTVLLVTIHISAFDLAAVKSYFAREKDTIHAAIIKAMTPPPIKKA